MIALPLVVVLSAASLGSAQSTSVNWNNVTGTSNITFPTAVGNPGVMVYGAAPILAEQDRLNTTKWQTNNFPVEMRWVPKDAHKDNATSDDIFRNQGATSPYRATPDLFPEMKQYQQLPDNCKLKQVHILHRHGSRYPIGLNVSGVGNFGEKVANATKNGTLHATGDLAFLNKWNYTMGSEVMVHLGTQEEFDSGVKHYYQYGKLLEKYLDKIVVRTTSQNRMLDSARYWMLGFFGWDAPTKAHLEVITEIDPKQNNTLAPRCNTSFPAGAAAVAQWRNVYIPNIQKRLQSQAKGLNLTQTDIYNMLSMCPYETVSQGYSRFCNIFTKEEWEQYEYDLDLGFQTTVGFMSPNAKALGVGWAQELLARLDQSNFTGPVTQQNATLDKNTTYFPVHQPLYVDFTHDSSMTAMLTAMNFTQFAGFLNPTKMDPHRKYRTSWVTPFGARFVFEVMECDENKQTNDFIRVKLNEGVVPLDKDQGCEKRADGLCKLNDFASNLRKAYKESHFEIVCYGKNGTDFNVTGLVENGSLNSSQILSRKH